MERKYERACKYCKEKGHTPPSCELAPVKIPSVPLTQTQYQMVKEMQSEGRWRSCEVADELGIALREANAAFAYSRYDSYLHFRRSRVMV